MGRGDRRTEKGKRFSKSFGKTRTKKSKERRAKAAEAESTSADNKSKK